MNQLLADELYMMECLALARKGAGGVSPNPMVGCVIVKKGRVIGRGYHRRFGGAHAEVDAVRSANASVRGATLYVNLEPCCYQGKTPPCTGLIIRSGIARVVIGTRDPNPLVSGRGIRRLRRSGVRVTVGVLEEECRITNEFFMKFVRTRLPFVTLKIAQSIDGKIALPGGRSAWITGLKSRAHVHVLRSQYDAVLVGAGTVRTDNPRLTVRHVLGRDPVRVVLDGRLRLSEKAAVFRQSKRSPVIVVVDRQCFRRQLRKAERLRRKGVTILDLEARQYGRPPLKEVLRALGSLGIASVLVEGGSSIFSSFVREAVCDKLLLFVAPKIIPGGTATFGALSPAKGKRPVLLRQISVITLEDDTLIEAYLH